jgi:hypothetical protein
MKPRSRTLRSLGFDVPEEESQLGRAPAFPPAARPALSSSPASELVATTAVRTPFPRSTRPASPTIDRRASRSLPRGPPEDRLPEILARVETWGQSALSH